MKINRRNFISKTTLASSSLLIPTNILAENLLFKSNTSTNSNLEIHLFSKHLQFLNYKNMCEAAKEMGFDGLDLTVRPKGHVLPENVEEDLPKATEFMKQYGLIPKMFASNVNSSENIIQQTVLKTAKDLGYKYYRSAWFKYKNDAIIETVNNAKSTIKKLEELNKNIGIAGSYHNHSGAYVGSAVWDLYEIIKDASPKNFGAQYDVMHATLEGGKNWETGFNLIKPFINTLVIKDFKWEKVNNKWKPVYTPLGEGMVDFKKYFSLLKKNNINVPISLHVEYDLGGAEHGGIPTMKNAEIFKKIKKDVDFIRKTWKVVS